MTGIGTYEHNGRHFSVVARPEIILKGTDDGGATWSEYQFLYKLGDVHVTPRANIPFQSRLNWQVWFAALGSYQGAPWIVHLIDKLLQGSSDAKALLDTARYPFPNKSPQAIRVQLYYYGFTRLNSTWSRGIPSAVIVNNTKEAAWWARTFHKEYNPALEQGVPAWHSSCSTISVEIPTSRSSSPTVTPRVHHQCGHGAATRSSISSCGPYVVADPRVRCAARWQCRDLLRKGLLL